MGQGFRKKESVPEKEWSTPKESAMMKKTNPGAGMAIPGWMNEQERSRKDLVSGRDA